MICVRRILVNFQSFCVRRKGPSASEGSSIIRVEKNNNFLLKKTKFLRPSAESARMSRTSTTLVLLPILVVPLPVVPLRAVPVLVLVLLPVLVPVPDYQYQCQTASTGTGANYYW